MAKISFMTDYAARTPPATRNQATLLFIGSQTASSTFRATLAWCAAEPCWMMFMLDSFFRKANVRLVRSTRLARSGRVLDPVAGVVHRQ